MLHRLIAWFVEWPIRRRARQEARLLRGVRVSPSWLHERRQTERSS